MIWEGGIYVSVTIKIFQEGKIVSEEMFAGHSINPVLEYLTDNDIDYHVDKGQVVAAEMTADKDITLMCIDDINIITSEPIANFFTEYLMLYDEDIYNEIKNILNEQRK